MASKMKSGSKRVAGAVKMSGGTRAPKQGKVGGISTPFSNRIMSGKR